MASSNSLVSRMKCCGLPAEKGCLIFSIINMIIASTCLAACICWIGWIYYKIDNANETHGLELFFHLIFSAPISIGTSICFVFAVLLWLGAKKREPKLIMTYFVFGVLVEILSFCTVIYSLTCDCRYFYTSEIIIIHVALIIIAVYPLALTVVFRAYMIMSDTAVLSSDHSKLMNEC